MCTVVGLHISSVNIKLISSHVKDLLCNRVRPRKWHWQSLNWLDMKMPSSAGNVDARRSQRA